MRAIRADRRRQSGWQVLLVILVALAVGGLGTVGVLGYTEVIDLGKLAFWKKPVTIPEGWVAIPVCAQPIPRYTVVERAYLLDPRRTDGSWYLDYQPPEVAAALARKGVITEIDRIRGRVTGRPKEAKQYFTETDFLPLGSRPGIAGGTPPGKQAFTVEAKKLKGARDLRAGDRINLLANIPVDMPGSTRSVAGRLGTVVASPDAAMLPKRGVGRPLVQDGVVVSPVLLRDIPVATKGGVVTRTTPIEEIVIAVDPEEVAPLAEALDLNYEITCVVRSGRPQDVALPSPQTSPGGSAAGAEQKQPSAKNVQIAVRDTAARPSVKREANDDTPGYNPMSGTRTMEIMVGSQRQFIVFGGANASPVASSQGGGSEKPDSQAQPGGEQP